MKILKISGAVLAVHAVFFLLIYATPGCSTTERPTPVSTLPSGATTAMTSDTPPMVTPIVLAPPSAGASSPVPMNIDPNAAAVAPDRYSPSRPAVTTPAAASAVSIPARGAPAPSQATAAPAAPVVAPPSTYTVVANDNLTRLASRNGITIKELAAANRISTEAVLKVGQKLVIPGRTVTGAAAPGAARGGVTAPAPKPPEGSVTHVVKANETLSGIAQKYQVKQGDISTANNLTDPKNIRPGMVLIIPGWQDPKATKGGAPATGAAKGGTTPVIKPASPPPNIPVIRIEGGGNP